jgi:hypothetical protein
MGVSSQYVASSASIADAAVTEAKLSNEACSAAKMKKEGTADYVLTSNGAGAVPSYKSLGAVSGDWVKISTTTLASAGNVITISSGLGATYKAFYFVFDWVATASQQRYWCIQVNADTTSTNYICQYIYESTVGQGVNGALAGYYCGSCGNATGNIGTAEGMLTNNSRYIQSLSYVSMNNKTGGRDFQSAMMGNGTYYGSATISRLDFKIDGDTFGIGSTVTIYGVKA